MRTNREIICQHRQKEREGENYLSQSLSILNLIFNFKFQLCKLCWAECKVTPKKDIINTQSGQHTKYNIIKANSMASHLHTLMSEQLPYLPLPIYLPCNLPKSPLTAPSFTSCIPCTSSKWAMLEVYDLIFKD